MSPSTRIPLLMLGACLLPLGAQATPVQSTEWYFGSAIEAATEEVPAEYWLVNYSDDAAVARVPKRNRTPSAPTNPPTSPSPSVPPNNTGAGVRVAVVDTGIQLNHPEFAGRIAAGGACFGTTSACSGASAQGNDNQGHGTHVAGIIAAAANGTGTTGVAPGASLLAVKVLDANGSGSYSAVAQGITYAAQSGAKIINMSLGGSSPSSTLVTPLQTAASTAVIVAAAGNSGNALAPGYPAAYATSAGIGGSMIIVGSVNASNQISSFSQTPGTGGCAASGGVTRCFRDVFLVAPGESIRSTYLNSGYAFMSGTSMATPYVSGVAARVLAASPFLTNRQVVQILLQSATDLGAPGTDAVYGRGLVNLAAALAPLGTTTIATSGATTGEASGSGQVSGSSISGTLGAGLRNSTLARNVMFFDAFGRDYTTDLTQSVASSAVSLADVVSRASWSSRFVTHDGEGYSASGFVQDTSENAVMSLGFTQDPEDNLSDLVITARLSDTTTVSFGHNASLQGRVNTLDLAADDRHDGLYMSASALNSPFLSLADGGDFGAAALRLNDTMTFSFGYSRSNDVDETTMYADVLADDRTLSRLTQDTEHARSAQSTLAAMSWNFAPWGTAGVSVGLTEEQNSLLGSTESGALAVTSDARTASVGAAVKLDLGDQWNLSASWSTGRTEASPVAGSILQSFSEIESQAYGIAIAKQGIFEDDDSLGFAVSRPLHVTSGTATIHASTGVTADREIIYTQETISLASSTPETDYEVGYTTKLSADTSLQANFIYQQNVGGEASEDAVAGLVTLKTRW